MKNKVLFSHRARRVFFFIHLWLGLFVGLWFSLVGVTGSVLAWRGEIGDWEIRQRYAVEKPAADASLITIKQATEAMKKAHPEASPRQLTTINVPNNDLPFYSFTLGESKRTRQTVLIDPYSARVHTPFQRSELGVVKIQQYHQRLLAGMRGYLVNGFFNFLAIPLVLSGLWLWWPTKLNHLKKHLTVKSGASLKRRLFDLHQVMGIYLYAVLLITTISGAVIVYQHVARAGLATYLRGEPSAPTDDKKIASATKPPERKEENTPQVKPNGKRLSADEILPIARVARPTQQLVSLKITHKPTQPYEATYKKKVGISTNETFFINPYNGQTMSAKASNIGFSQVNKALHLGVFGGVISKLIYTITGLMPLGLFITGVWLWLNKKWRSRNAT